MQAMGVTSGNMPNGYIEVSAYSDPHDSDSRRTVVISKSIIMGVVEVPFNMDAIPKNYTSTLIITPPGYPDIHCSEFYHSVLAKMKEH